MQNCRTRTGFILSTSIIGLWFEKFLFFCSLYRKFDLLQQPSIINQLIFSIISPAFHLFLDLKRQEFSNCIDIQVEVAYDFTLRKNTGQINWTNKMSLSCPEPVDSTANWMNAVRWRKVRLKKNNKRNVWKRTWKGRLEEASKWGFCIWEKEQKLFIVAFRKKKKSRKVVSLVTWGLFLPITASHFNKRNK